MADPKSTKITEQTRTGYRPADWARFMAAYRGGRPYAQGSLVQHPREDLDCFNRRKAMAYTINYSCRIVKTRTAFLSKKPPAIEVPTALDDYIDNLDMQGNDIGVITETVASWSQINGCMVIVVDRPKTTREYLSKAEQDAAGDRPYMTLMQPGALKNYGVGENGEFTWALIKQSPKGQSLDDSTSPKLVDTVGPAYVLWTRDAFYFYNDKGELQPGSEGINPTGQVPVVKIQFVEDPDDPHGYGISILEDIEAVQARIVNDYSQIDDLVDKQTFSTLIHEGKLHGKMGTDSKGKPVALPIKVGTSDTLEYAPQTTHPPQYISPDASQGKLVLESLKDKKEEIFQLAEVKRGTVKETSSPISGISKAYDFIDTNQSLSRQAGLIAAGLERAFYLMGLWAGLKDDQEKYTVTFPTDFGVNTSGEVVMEYKELNGVVGTAGAPPVALNQEYLRTITNARFPDLPESEKKVIMDGIEEMEEAEPMLPEPVEVVEIEPEIEGESK